MAFSSKIYRLLEQVDSGLRGVLVAILEEIEKQREQWEQSVTKKEFNELKEIVQELAEAQRETEHWIERLAKAQEKTEQRVSRLEKVVERLAKAQEKTEQRVSRLEEVVEELAEAQKRTEQRVEELAEAQRKTEIEIQKLSKELTLVKERLEGVSNSVGYSLENKTYKALPSLLKKDLGLEPITPLIRKYLNLPKGKKFQANIYGLARRDGKEIIILGECKVRPSKKELRRFLSRVKQLSQIKGKDVVPIVVAHDFPPEIEEYLKGTEIRYYWSYELE